MNTNKINELQAQIKSLTNELEALEATSEPTGTDASMLVSYVGKYMMIRTYSAGVFFGKLADISLNGKCVIVKDVRRVHCWRGGASLSELATLGTSKPSECRFPASIPEILLTEVIEMIPLTDKAKKSLDSVEIWTSH